MKKVSALIFPETEPSIQTIAKLLLFFDSLSYYLPTESDLANSKNKSFFTNLCSPYIPAPLTEEELFRFNRLLREMETSRPDELSRLFSTVTAPLATGQLRDLDEISASRVYSALQKNAETIASIRYKERLWQARLILKLAEMLDRREVEVRQGLAQISSVEQKVFAALEGRNKPESDDSVVNPDKLKHPIEDDILHAEPSLGTSGLHISMRLKAWAELFMADSSEQQPMILVTGNSECGLTLLEGYENIRRLAPVKLFSLVIPALHFACNKEAEATYQADRQAFRDAVHENMEYLARYLQKTTDSAESKTNSREKLSTLAKNLSSWENNVKHYLPASEKSVRKLDFYCFPGISFAELFQQMFHLKLPVPEKKMKQPTGILAILKP